MCNWHETMIKNRKRHTTRCSINETKNVFMPLGSPRTNISIDRSRSFPARDANATRHRQCEGDEWVLDRYSTSIQSSATVTNLQLATSTTQSWLWTRHSVDLFPLRLHRQISKWQATNISCSVRLQATPIIIYRSFQLLRNNVPPSTA